MNDDRHRMEQRMEAVAAAARAKRMRIKLWIGALIGMALMIFAGMLAAPCTGTGTGIKIGSMLVAGCR